MRLASLALSSALLCLVACASSSSEGGGAPPSNAPTGDGNKESTTPGEAPLTAHPVCKTVTTGTKFGSGCSGSGTGDRVCAFESASECDADKCVYDSRGSTYSFTCSATCTVGDSTLCPLGYECVTADPSCSEDTKGVCASRSDFTCDKDELASSGTILEGPLGEVLLMAPAISGKMTLSVRKNAKFIPIATWTEEGASIVALAHASDTLFIVTGKNEIVVKDGDASVSPRKATATSSPIYSSAKDGSFVMLEPQGWTAAYAALSKRAPDGAWTEVGPTRQRLTNLKALNMGFIARCDDTLCGSTNGEDFTPIALPDGVTLDLAGSSDGTPRAKPIALAGVSAEDFYMSIDGALYHHRKGAWVTEGPKALPKTEGGAPSSSHPDILRVSSTGLAVWNTYDPVTFEYQTYVSGTSCWMFSPTGNLDNATLVKDTFVYRSINSQLCSRPAK